MQYIPHSMGILFDLHMSDHSKTCPVDTGIVLQLQNLHYAIQGKGCILVGLKCWKKLHW
jgi:hypothetical protein